MLGTEYGRWPTVIMHTEHTTTLQYEANMHTYLISLSILFGFTLCLVLVTYVLDMEVRAYCTIHSIAEGEVYNHAHHQHHL